MITLEIKLPVPWEQRTFDGIFSDLSKIVGLISEVTEGLLDDRRKHVLFLPHRLTKHLKATRFNGSQSLYQAIERALHPGVVREHAVRGNMWPAGRADLFYEDGPRPPMAQIAILGIGQENP